jgi:hypothetical protein
LKVCNPRTHMHRWLCQIPTTKKNQLKIKDDTSFFLSNPRVRPCVRLPLGRAPSPPRACALPLHPAPPRVPPPLCVPLRASASAFPPARPPPQSRASTLPHQTLGPVPELPSFVSAVSIAAAFSSSPAAALGLSDLRAGPPCLPTNPHRRR